MAHKPNHLRDALQGYLDSDDSAADFVVEDDNGEQRSLAWLLGQLWHCTDVAPWDLCDLLGLPRGSTYAQAVRQLKERPEMMGRDTTTGRVNRLSELL